MAERWTRTGKQVLQDGRHFADAINEIAAELIVSSLRLNERTPLSKSLGVAPTYRDLTSAPHDRDVILRTPKHGDVRAVWWDGWEDPDVAACDRWCWREARDDGTVGKPIDEADGWREIDG